MPVKPWHLRSLLNKSMRCTKTYNACGNGQQKGSNSSPQHLTAHHTNNASKAEQIGLWSFASSSIFTNWLPLLQASWQLFAGKTLPPPAGGRKCFPRVLWILKHGFLCYRNKQTFLTGKNVLMVMVSILINKDVLSSHRTFCPLLLGTSGSHPYGHMPRCCSCSTLPPSAFYFSAAKILEGWLFPS